MMADPLDASLADYLPPTPPLTQEQEMKFGYPSAHSGFRSEESDEEGGDGAQGSAASAGGYSPPAWRRLGNGGQSSGFWRAPPAAGGFGGFDVEGRDRSRESSPEYEDSVVDEVLGQMEEEKEEVLARAVRTRLPAGSMSPEKGRSPEPEVKRERSIMEESKATVEGKDFSENCKPTIIPRGTLRVVTMLTRSRHPLRRPSRSPTAHGTNRNSHYLPSQQG
jgi:hypothetical protein